MIRYIRALNATSSLGITDLFNFVHLSASFANDTPQSTSATEAVLKVLKTTE